MNSDIPSFEIGKNRIEALSDGIFAIVMTLLILELHVPNLPATAPNVEVTRALLNLWPKFLSYLVAFVSLGVFWVVHHMMYHAVVRADRTLLWLNIAFFMFVSLLPFSTSVLNAFPRALIAPFLFGANLALVGWLLFFQWVYISSQPEMLAAFVTTEYRDGVKSRLLAVPIATTLTAFVCFWSAGISVAIYLLLLPVSCSPENSSNGKCFMPHGSARSATSPDPTKTSTAEAPEAASQSQAVASNCQSLSARKENRDAKLGVPVGL